MRVDAPFTVDQVASMNAYQQSATDPVHCTGSELVYHTDPQVMTASAQGWRCQWCQGVVQDWAESHTTDWSWLGTWTDVQVAAKILNVTPGYVEGAVTLGELPATLFLKVRDVLLYRAEKDKETRVAADEHTRMSQELGLTD